MIELVIITINSKKPALEISCNAYVVAFILIVAIGYFLWRRWKSKPITAKMVPVEVTVGSDNTIKYSIERNDKNVEVAYKIYIELVTRKAAIEVDPENDVIEEVYNSWYHLFGIIREEIKTLPGLFIRDGLGKNSLVGFTLAVLNEGLRPHLTEHQAKFRRWYGSEKANEGNDLRSPQEIQKRYPKYNDLIADMKRVNQVLLDYSHQLKKLIEGDM